MFLFQKGKIEKRMAGGDIALEEEMAPCSVKTENWQGGARSGAGGAGKISTIAIRVNSSACVPKYERGTKNEKNGACSSCVVLQDIVSYFMVLSCIYTGEVIISDLKNLPCLWYIVEVSV